MMDYEIGGVAHLISGLHTPNRERVVARAVTPRKRPPEEPPVTPKESPLGRIKAPKIAFTPETDPAYRTKSLRNSVSTSTFESPKSVTRKRQIKLTNNFQFLSQMSDNESVDGRANNSQPNDDEFVREYYIDKHGKKTLIKGGKNKSFGNEFNSSDVSSDDKKNKSKRKKDKNNRSTDEMQNTDFEEKTNSKRKSNLEEGEENENQKKKKLKRNNCPPIDDDTLVEVKEKKKSKKCIEESNETSVNSIEESFHKNKKAKKDKKHSAHNDNDDFLEENHIERSENVEYSIKKQKKLKNMKPDEDNNSIPNDDYMSEKKKRKKQKFVLENTESDEISKKKKKISNDDSSSLEKTIENQKYKSKTKKSFEENNENDQNEEFEEEKGDEGEDEEELSEFQKAAKRRIDLKAKRDLKFEPDETSRTIFVGNIPIMVLKGKYKKTFKGIFAKYGEIESIRVRNVPVGDLKTKPKVAFIEKNFHPERTTASIYIKFKMASSAKEALAENNTILEGNHIRVDSCGTKNHQADSRRTLFLGNLPFNVEEETVRALFEKCGPVKSVRLVRDRKTQIGKGFGFVNFEKTDAIEFALMMAEDDLKIGNKIVRIKRYNSQSNNNDDSYRPRVETQEKSKKRQEKQFSSKKRDAHGNKIRKHPRVPKESTNDGDDEAKMKTNDSSEVKPKPSSNESFKGLVAKKKKKNKINKGILKKKKISKMLMKQ